MQHGNRIRSSGPWSSMALKALEEFPGGAYASVVCDELGLEKPLHRKQIRQALSHLALGGKIARTGMPGSYLYRLHEHHLDALEPSSKRTRRLDDDHPAVTAAREAAGYLRPDLARRLIQLADWATGEHAS